MQSKKVKTRNCKQKLPLEDRDEIEEVKKWKIARKLNNLQVIVSKNLSPIMLIQQQINPIYRGKRSKCIHKCATPSSQ